METSVPATEQVPVANLVLTNAQSIQDQLTEDLSDSSSKLSQALLAVVMYTERVENATHLLLLANTCISKIRAQMHAHGIQIDSPSSEITPPSDVGTTLSQGSSIYSHIADPHP